MPGELKLRRATPEDAPYVAEVILLSRKELLPYAPLPHTDAEVRQWVAEVLVPAGNVVVACTDSRVLGVLAASQHDGASWIDHLYVVPGSVGKGIGSQLLGSALSWLARPVWLYTFQANMRARRFYERFGFCAVALSDGSTNEERCPDVLYELSGE